MGAAVVLLPPSEGKAVGGQRAFRPASGAFRSLGSARREVIAALALAPPSVLGVRGDLLTRAMAGAKELTAGRARALPAWQRYTGVVWRHLDPLGLSDDERGAIVIPSALLGVTTAGDPIPDYRLKFSVTLPGLGRLAPWWRASVTTAVARFADGRPVIDLLPAEHSAAIDWPALGPAVCHVRFEQQGGSAAGHAAKAAKGLLARAIVRDGLDDAVRFRWQGWRVQRQGDDLVVRHR